MKSENTKLTETIKAVADEMSTKIEIANKICQPLKKKLERKTTELRRNFLAN